MTTYGCVCERCSTPYLTTEWRQPWLCAECRRGIAFYQAFQLVKGQAA